jgi:[ribosomal protein S5]-alanine N-acetyltransferase
MELIPVKQHLEENQEFLDNPECHDTIHMTIDFYKKIGYHFPWTGYYASINGELVGSAGFKGRPVDGKVEIAYGTMPQFRSKGIGTEICKKLVELSLATDPTVRIFARTFSEENHSAAILRKNEFELQGIVEDPEDGPVWEWEYKGER